MIRVIFAAATTETLLAMTDVASAQAIELQWWHAMTAANATVVNQIAADFNASQSEYKGRPGVQGLLCRDDECRHRRLSRRQGARHSSDIRGGHRDDDGRQGCGDAGPSTYEGRRRAVRPECLSAGGHRVLQRRRRQDAVI